MPSHAPYGSWRSPITADLLVAQAVRLGQVTIDDDDVYWNEGRPADGGRQVVVRMVPDGVTTDVLPAGFGARTLAHEYGGQSYAVRDGVVFFSNFADQQVYRVEAGSSEPRPLTGTPTVPSSVRFADHAVSVDGAWLLCVRERHLGASAAEVANDLVAVSTDGGEPVVLVEGSDFYAAPRLSPDGATLAWLSWDHPNMPWDGTELWSAPFVDGRIDGAPMRVAGGANESVSQPRWSPDGRLHYISDRTGWWNLYDGDGLPLCTREAEFSLPDWVFGQSSYGFLSDGAVVAAMGECGFFGLVVIRDGAAMKVNGPWSSVSSLHVVGHGASIVALVASPTVASAVVRIEVPSGVTTVLRRSRPDALDAALISVPEPIEFPTTDGGTAHAFFYPPRNPDFVGDDGERPPLIVMSHGGPTSAARAELDVGLQYWTSRGFAVVDVNYGGSTGFGREYRNRLRDAWGVVDVDDCVNAAKWLASEGRVDGNRMVITGGSAGGYTTLAALTFRDVFAAGASHYGVADAEALAKDTHKFESRYLDGLIGPYPAARDIYVERSPIHHTALLDRPMILFQGLEDRVVPPDQAEMMAEALREKGIPFAHLSFEGEQHGFRKAETIIRVAEAELWFYGKVLGFAPADEVAPVPIENEEGLGRPGVGESGP